MPSSLCSQGSDIGINAGSDIGINAGETGGATTNHKINNVY